MLNFFAGAFVVAGLAAAAGPLIIHLLNRRRFRVEPWAAMDFLREAVQRNRRVLQLRDLILLTLRVLCVILFGLALARPFFTTAGDESLFRYIWLGLAIAAAFGLAIWALLSSSRATKITAGLACAFALLLSAGGVYGVIQQRAAAGEGPVSSRQPVHAVLVLDNSLSMGYETLEGTLLDQARAKALDFVEELPPESRISVIPLCGSEQAFSLDAYRSRDDARDAIKRISVVDRGGTAATAIELAVQACQQAPELPAKRVIFIGDQQISNWPADSLQTALEQLPELQVVQVAAGPPENLWVSDFRVQDGIVDIETPAVFRATVEYNGPAALSNVQVNLSVDDVSVASQTIELEPGQAREVEFKHSLDVQADPGQPNYVHAVVTVTTDAGGDRLPSDNQRYLAVPVVAGLPVVFVDQHGADEDLAKNIIGETYPLRRLLAPRDGSEDSHRQLIQVRHVALDRLDQETLQDARLVVMAGLSDPGDAVPLLRQYVEQGGQLVIAAGAEFDPAAWNEAAWLDGAGILPAPLKPEPVGQTPDEASAQETLAPLLLDFNSMHHPFFRLEGEPDQRLADLYRSALFFKAAEVDLNDKIRGALVQSEAKRLTAARAFLKESDARRAKWAEMEKTGTFGAAEEAERQADDAQRRIHEPAWLLWRREIIAPRADLSPAELAQQSVPQVLASFDGRPLPFLVERRVNQGRVLFFASGAQSDWNTLTRGIAILMFDRIFRQLLDDTLPHRTFETGLPIALPVEPSEQLHYALARPSGGEEILPVEALGSDAYGLLVRNAATAGAYQITARRTPRGDENQEGEKVREIPLALNGPPRESDLRTLDAEGLKTRLGDANYRWIAAEESISLEGAQVRGRNLWKRLIQVVLLALGVEMLVLAWPTAKQSLAKEPAAA